MSYIFIFADGTLLYERVPNKPEAEKAALNNVSASLLKRRAFEEVNGMDGKINFFCLILTLSIAVLLPNNVFFILFHCLIADMEWDEGMALDILHTLTLIYY